MSGRKIGNDGVPVDIMKKINETIIPGYSTPSAGITIQNGNNGSEVKIVTAKSHYNGI